MNNLYILNFRRYIFGSIAALSLLTTTALAQSTTSTQSAASFVGSALVVSGSPYLLLHSGAAAVESVKVAGESIYLVLKSPLDASLTTVKFSTKALGGASITAGESIRVVTNAAGSLLVYAGKLLAVVPNEVGKSLMHQSTH